MSLPNSAKRTGTGGGLDDARCRFLNHAADGNLEGAVAVAMDLYGAGVEAGDIVHELLRPAQVEVGRRWAHNEWGVAEERLTTQAATTALTLIDSSTRRTHGHGNLLVACVEEEAHVLPARILASDLRRAGWRVSFLGDSVPAVELRGFAARQQFDAVLLSCVTPLSLIPTVHSVTAIHQLGVPVIVGGRAFGGELTRAERVGADGYASNAAGVARLLEHPPRVRRQSDGAGASEQEQWAVLETNRHDIADQATRRLDIGVADASVFRTQLHRLVRVAAAAVVVEDDRVFDCYVDWLVDFCRTRGWNEALVYELCRSLSPVVSDYSAKATQLLGRTQDRLADHFDQSPQHGTIGPKRVRASERTTPAASNEPARLAAVASYETCLSDPDLELQELAGMAATLCETPVAWIGLLGEESQWFPAAHGVHLHELPRELAICTLPVAQAELVVIPDLASDERFADHPLVLSESRWRFYAGAPLTVGGLAVGTLAVLDYRPRLLRLDEQRHLMTLAREAMGKLELRRLAQRQVDRPAPTAMSRPEAQQLLEHVIDLRNVDDGSRTPSLGTRDIARLLNVSTRTVINWATQGKLPALKTAGGHYRFSSEAVIEFLVRSEGMAESALHV